uniref:Uncharacterized protein n=1 Tax=Heterorhabditis bacteriophora TaxID=37862 RepID=A0A1I7WXE0_HETBA
MGRSIYFICDPTIRMFSRTDGFAQVTKINCSRHAHCDSLPLARGCSHYIYVRMLNDIKTEMKAFCRHLLNDSIKSLFAKNSSFYDSGV